MQRSRPFGGATLTGRWASRRARAVAAVALLASTSSIAAAPPRTAGEGANKVGTIQEFDAPFGLVGRLPDARRDAEYNAPTCDDGDGTLVCTLSADADRSGSLSAAAALRPVGGLVPANPGLAWGTGWAGEWLRIPSDLTRIDVTGTFVVDSAAVASALSSGGSVDARIIAWLDGCDDCAPYRTDVRVLLAGAGGSASTEQREVTVTTSITPPQGFQTIPKGRLSFHGSLAAVVNSTGPLFTGEVRASVQGRLTSLSVSYVA